jgi:hypothetical protein
MSRRRCSVCRSVTRATCATAVDFLGFQVRKSPRFATQMSLQLVKLKIPGNYVMYVLAMF